MAAKRTNEETRPLRTEIGGAFHIDESR
jgi:hypothetical protein